MSISPFEAQDVEAGVTALLTGSFPGFNAAFRPPAPQVGAACRFAMDARLDSEHRERARQPQLLPPDVVKDEDSRARVAAMVDGFVNKAAASMRTDEAAAHKRRLDHAARVNDKFDPDADADAMRRRLGFSVGNSDIDGDWGGEAA